MNTSDTDHQNELLKSIASSLKGIQTSLEQLTGAVEGVAESIEKAHEPEGDLGVHLVNALKEVSSSLQRRSQQERTFQPQLQHSKQHPRNRRPEHQQQNISSRGDMALPPEERDAVEHTNKPESGSGTYSVESDTNSPQEARKPPRGNTRRGKRPPPPVNPPKILGSLGSEPGDG